MASPTDEESIATVPVVEVTLQEDRALVRRRGQLVLPPGPSRVTIEDVAPVLVDKTLAAELAAPDGTPMGADTRARRVTASRWRVHPDRDGPAETTQLRAKARELQREHDAVQLARGRVIDEREALSAVADLTLAELAEDVAWGRGELGQGERDLDQVEAKLAALGQQACTLEAQRRTLADEVRDVQRLIAATDTLQAHARAKLVVELHNASDAASTVVLTVDYAVPGAMWRPCHTAQLNGDTVRVQTDGCVWQATGEDWTEVALIFSTERPSLGVSPPTLQTDHVIARKRSSEVQVAAREQTVHTAGLGQDDAIAEVDDELPGVDDGGQVVTLRGLVRATVPSDGRPHRVPVAQFEAPTQRALLCVPELAPAIVLRTRQANAGAGPLLAGPVDLVRDSGLVGRTSVLYIAAGERFDLGWGPEPTLRVQREVEFLETSRRALSSWTRNPRRVSVKLSNLGPKPATIELKERVATSEIEKVEVELDQASHDVRPDDDGFVSWTIPLRGFGRDEVQVAWTLVVHDDVSGL